MKALSILRLKGIQVVRWRRRIGCSGGGGGGSAAAVFCFRRREEMECGGGSAAAVLCFRRREEMECGGGGGPYFLRQLICRLRSQWKQLALRRERSSGIALYSYDIRSYSQNFDEGNCLDDHLSPLAPR